MEKLKKTEFIFIAFLWLTWLLSLSYDLLNNYEIYISDTLAGIGLVSVTLVFFLKPEKALGSLVVLLLLGVFNVLSFEYFVNILFTFRVGDFDLPKIQLFSLVALILLSVRKKVRIVALFHNTFSQSSTEKEEQIANAENHFKKKFENLSNEEIDLQLQKDLVPEAISALNKIKDTRQDTTRVD